MQSFVRNAKWAGLSVLLVSGAAYGSFLPIFTTTGPSGANTQFNYDLNFSTGATGGGQPAERLEQGDFVTIYDIGGFVSASAPAGFSVSIQNSGIDGTGTLPADDPALPNVTFTYTGAPLTTDTNINGANVISNLSGSVLDNFTSETTGNATSNNGQAIGHIGLVAVPAIPEPASVIGLGAFGAIYALRRRSR